MSEEYKTPLQSNISWGETFKMSRKAPTIANRIFATLESAQRYINDKYDSATEGIRISVIKDPDPVKNGLYYVKSIGDGVETNGELVQVGRGSAAWYKGNAVKDSNLGYKVIGATAGDCYMNTNTYDIYVLGEDGKWDKKGSMIANVIDKTKPYYILSTNGKKHPPFSLDTWSVGNDDDENGNGIPTNYEEVGNGKQVYLWTRFYDEDREKENLLIPKYTVSLVYSTLNLGTFNIK